MKYLQRVIQKRFIKKLIPNKVLVLLGARRTGKTIFLQQVMKTFTEPYLMLNGEDTDTLDALARRSVKNYKDLIGKNKILIIDEAQKIPDIGTKLKLMVDELKGLKIIATGSSAFDLTGKLGEPLTGRQFVFHLFPLAQMELAETETMVQTKANLEDRLIYGSYPELLHQETKEEKTEYLKEIINSNLLKDLLTFEGLRNSTKLLDLLRLISFQIGNEVSYQELGNQLGISKNTVERYLDLLSKVFIIFRVQGFSRNLRKEVTKNSKWYFYDNGIRNALIANLNPLSLRGDTGALWENYIISERIKFQHYTGMTVNNYFWRTYQQQELDWIEERGGQLHAYELKWNAAKKVLPSKTWTDAYPKSKFSMINSGNYRDWIGA